jgi:hypothetical protein
LAVGLKKLVFVGYSRRVNKLETLIHTSMLQTIPPFWAIELQCESHTGILRTHALLDFLGTVVCLQKLVCLQLVYRLLFFRNRPAAVQKHHLCSATTWYTTDAMSHQGTFTYQHVSAYRATASLTVKDDWYGMCLR